MITVTLWLLILTPGTAGVSHITFPNSIECQRVANDIEAKTATKPGMTTIRGVCVEAKVLQ